MKRSFECLESKMLTAPCDLFRLIPGGSFEISPPGHWDDSDLRLGIAHSTDTDCQFDKFVTVDWGDGESNTRDVGRYSSNYYSHHYAEPGVYRIVATTVDGQELSAIDQVVADWFMGDVDGNGYFNSGDLVKMFENGKYETGEAATRFEGDFNRDGVFDSSDFVFALSNGAEYVP